MGAVRTIYSSWIATIFLFFAVSAYWASYIWPPITYWYELRSVSVADAHAGQPIILRVDRSINHSFVGEFDVILRRLTPDGWQVVCTGDGGGDYRTDSALPDPLTLEWWSNGGCTVIDQPGKYMVSTTLQVFPGLHLRRIITNESNIFEVTE